MDAAYIVTYYLFIAALFITGILLLKYKEKRLLIGTAAVFVMLVLLILPHVEFNLLTAFYDSLQVFGADGDITLAVGDPSEGPGQGALRAASGFWRGINGWTLLLLFCIAPILGGGYLLTSFSHNINSRFRMLLNSGKPTYFFSAPSRQALLFAKSLKKTQQDNVCCVFCDVSSDDYDKVYEEGFIPFSQAINLMDAG